MALTEKRTPARQRFRHPVVQQVKELREGPPGIIGVILGLYRGYIGIMEKKMETTT